MGEKSIFNFTGKFKAIDTGQFFSTTLTCSHYIVSFGSIAQMPTPACPDHATTFSSPLSLLARPLKYSQTKRIPKYATCYMCQVYAVLHSNTWLPFYTAFFRFEWDLHLICQLTDLNRGFLFTILFSRRDDGHKYVNQAYLERKMGCCWKVEYLDNV